MKTTSFAKRFVTLTLGLFLLLAGTAAPQTAHAVPSFETNPMVWFNDISTAIWTGKDSVKEYVLDPLAWAFAKTVIHSISKSTVNWINNGFDGSPAFETDLRRSLGQLQDSVADDFFDALEESTGVDVDSPFKEQVTDYLRTSYYRSTNGSRGFWETNLKDTTPDPKAFREGKLASNGGWDAWFSQVMNSNNNTYGAVINKQNQLMKDIESFRVQRLNELQWGRGFFAWKGSCIKREEGSGTKLSQSNSKCLEYETKTPGTVIETQLEESLGTNLDQLELADEIDEIVAALMQQLTSQVLGEMGLSGVSRPSSGGGASFIERAASQSSVSSNLESSFLQTISNLETSVIEYKADWTKIRDAAQSAKEACSTRNDQESLEQIQPILDRALESIGSADTAIVAIQALEAKATEASKQTTNKSAALAAVVAEYQTLTSSTVIPSAQAITEAEAQSQNISDPPTLYSTVKTLGNECIVGIIR